MSCIVFVNMVHWHHCFQFWKSPLIYAYFVACEGQKLCLYWSSWHLQNYFFNQLYQNVLANQWVLLMIPPTWFCLLCVPTILSDVYTSVPSQPYDVPPIPLDSESAFIGINSGEAKMPDDLIVPKPLASRDVPGTSKPKVRSAASD